MLPHLPLASYILIIPKIRVPSSLLKTTSVFTLFYLGNKRDSLPVKYPTFFPQKCTDY